MPDRTVKQTLASYRRADGSMGYALAGETVDVGDDDVKRFDEVNGPPKPEDTAEFTQSCGDSAPAPKRKPARKESATPFSRKT